MSCLRTARCSRSSRNADCDSVRDTRMEPYQFASNCPTLPVQTMLRNHQPRKTRMPKCFALICFIAVALSNQPSHAQVMLDVAKITCTQWAGYKITNPQNIAY